MLGNWDLCVCVGGCSEGASTFQNPGIWKRKSQRLRCHFFLVCEVEGMAGPLENQAAVSLKSLEWLLEQSKSKLQSAGATGKRRGCLDQI